MHSSCPRPELDFFGKGLESNAVCGLLMSNITWREDFCSSLQDTTGSEPSPNSENAWKTILEKEIDVRLTLFTCFFAPPAWLSGERSDK